MKLKGALSVPREKLLEFKADAFKELLRGVLTVTRLNFPQVRRGFLAYLRAQDLHPTDESVLNWLQENTGEVVGAFIFETKDGKIDFLVRSGTAAELRQIGVVNVEETEEGSDTQGTPRVRQVYLGERKGAEESGVVQEGQQGRPSHYD